jgi:hypothetical protein
LSSLEDAWRFPGFFHLTAVRTIEGSLAVKYGKTRQGLFNFSNPLVWKETPPGYQYLPGCSFCVLDDCVTGTLIARKVGDVKGPIINFQAQLARNRLYAVQNKKYVPSFRSVSLLCTLHGDVTVSSSPGLLSLIASSLSLRVNTRHRKTPPQDVVCGRALFGGMDPEVLFRFATFYTSVWAFHRVVVYDVGLVPESFWHAHAGIIELRDKGRLVVIDFKTELLRLYGATKWNDVVLLSAAQMQMDTKFDCVNRAKGLGGRWTLHLDMDGAFLWDIYVFLSKHGSFQCSAELVV